MHTANIHNIILRKTIVIANIAKLKTLTNKNIAYSNC